MLYDLEWWAIMNVHVPILNIGMTNGWVEPGQTLIQVHPTWRGNSKNFTGTF